MNLLPKDDLTDYVEIALSFRMVSFCPLEERNRTVHRVPSADYQVP